MPSSGKIGSIQQQKEQLLLECHKHSLSNSQATQIKELIHDIIYLEEMKKLEEQFFVAMQQPSPQSPNKPSDIVPITGLILNRLHRLENELKTVVDHWKNRRIN